MEDSGIDSDPKPPTIAIDAITTTTTTITTASPSNYTDDGRTFLTNDISISSNHQTQQYRRQRQCTTKQLQRKLEARIEQAKRIQRSNTDYIETTNNDCKTNVILSKSTGLIPIRRLHIPHHNDSLMHHERYPLVEYWQSDCTTDSSEDETTIFPLSRNKQMNCSNHKQDLTDTFSIQESSEDSEDSLNLIVPTTLHHTSHFHTRYCTPIGCCNSPCRII